MIPQRARIEINLKNLAYNFHQIRQLVSRNVKIMGVVKANAYGHGVIEIVKKLVDEGVHSLCVATLNEAIEIRTVGVKIPILVIEPIPSGVAAEIITYQISPAVFTMDIARELSKEALRLNSSVDVHIKIDTGMWRLGISYKNAVQFVKEISLLEGIRIAGIFSHLATAYALDKSYAYEQFSRFNHVLQKLALANIHIPLKHIASTAAILDLPEMHLDLVRPGIGLYGLFPAKTVTSNCHLLPVMEVKTQIVYLESVPKGNPISYGQTYITTKRERIGILPIGYSHGYSRVNSNKGVVLVKGKRAPVIGTVCMDFCIIDVTEIEGVNVGDEVTIFGKQGDDFIPVEDIAEICGTINYEIVTRMSDHLPRVYIRGGDISDK